MSGFLLQEPYPTELPTQTSIAVKKNRLAPTPSDNPARPSESDEPDLRPELEPKRKSSLDNEDPAKPTEVEGRIVGEMRRKVEKMTYEEDGEKVDEEGNDSGEWEKIDKEDVDDGVTNEVEVEGEGLKRKAAHRSESSTAQGNDGVKRQKETPSVRFLPSHLKFP